MNDKEKGIMLQHMQYMIHFVYGIIMYVYDLPNGACHDLVDHLVEHFTLLCHFIQGLECDTKEDGSFLMWIHRCHCLCNRRRV